MKYDKKMMETLATDIENYVEIVDRFLIIDGLDEEAYAKARKKIKKLIKHLKKGEGDKVFDKKRYIEYMESRGNR